MREVYSHSRLSSFEDCPKKFEYRYVLRLPSETESIEGFVGKRVHEVLERLYRAAGRGHVPSLAQVVHRYRQLFDDAYDPQRVRIVRSDTTLEHYRESGERCLVNYYRRFYPFDADETLGIEERVVFALDGDGAYLIRGVIDRIVRARDDAIEIHDYKTSRRVPPQDRLDTDRQLALYQLALAGRYDAGQPVRLVWHYVMRDQVRTSSRTAEQLHDLGAQTMELIDRIRAERSYEPRPGPLCRWCEYADRCPANPNRSADAPAREEPAAQPSTTAAVEPDSQLVLL